MILELQIKNRGPVIHLVYRNHYFPASLSFLLQPITYSLVFHTSLCSVQLLACKGFYKRAPIFLFQPHLLPISLKYSLSSQAHSFLPKPLQKQPLLMKFSQPKQLPPQTPTIFHGIHFLKILFL